jgi:hypothetical protein
MVLQCQPQPIEYVKVQTGIFTKCIEAKRYALESPVFRVNLGKEHHRKVTAQAPAGMSNHPFSMGHCDSVDMLRDPAAGKTL